MDRPRRPPIERRLAHGRSRPGRTERVRDRLIAATLALAAATLLLTAHADAGTAPAPSRLALSAPAPSTRHLTAASAPRWTADPLPPGWHEVDRPLTDVTIPVQVFAAATYPIVLHHPPGQCGPPRRVLSEMPPGGVLLQVIEYPPRAPDGHPLRVPRLPRRPHHFTWADGTWARFECAGPSFKFDYRQSGHALQAQVWMNPTTVAPLLRAGALRILDNLQKERPARLAGRS
jgi:hypothetical protein